MKLPFDNSFHDQMAGFYAPAEAARPSAPAMLAFNAELAASLGLDLSGVDDDALARVFSGAELPEGAQPIALAYAGHQFGHFSPQLGDGRALLLGEVVTPGGARFDIQLKGSGPTAFSRNGDGKAAIGPVLREFLVSEAMAAMGISTTRSLAAVATGDRVQRQRGHPGAVLTRVASSHIRVGTFQFFAAHLGAEHVIQLADYSIRRHFPDAAARPNPYLALLDQVIQRQCSLIAQWLGVGFVHGVMNTDNVAISGETIDYGPCAFIDQFSVNAVFSSIDANGRYAYGRQPQILHWNMARFAEALLPAVHSIDPADVEKAKALVDAIPDRFRIQWLTVMFGKLGLESAGEGDAEPNADLIDGLFDVLEQQGADFTGFFRALANSLRGDEQALANIAGESDALTTWLARWRTAVAGVAGELLERADAMDRVNPIYIPRNHLVEAALAAAEEGDLSAWEALLEMVRAPYVLRPDADEYAQPAPDDFGKYTTYCGT